MQKDTLSAGKGTFKGDSSVKDADISERKKLIQERNRSYLVIVGMFAIILVLTIALAVSVSTKEIQPYLVTVDATTGHIVKTQVATPEILGAHESVIQSEAHNYVLARNTADHSDRQRIEDYVATHSIDEVNKQYKGKMTANNVDSPYIRMGPRGRQSVKINAVSPTEKGRAQVFFETSIDIDGKQTEKKFWQANMTYVFTGEAKLGFDRRWVNPLGYIVTSYSQDEQLAKPISSSPSTASAASTN